MIIYNDDDLLKLSAETKSVHELWNNFKEGKSDNELRDIYKSIIRHLNVCISVYSKYKSGVDKLVQDEVIEDIYSTRVKMDLKCLGVTNLEDFKNFNNGELKKVDEKEIKYTYTFFTKPQELSETINATFQVLSRFQSYPTFEELINSMGFSKNIKNFLFSLFKTKALKALEYSEEPNNTSLTMYGVGIGVIDTTETYKWLFEQIISSLKDVISSEEEVIKKEFRKTYDEFLYIATSVSIIGGIQLNIESDLEAIIKSVVAETSDTDYDIIISGVNEYFLGTVPLSDYRVSEMYGRLGIHGLVLCDEVLNLGYEPSNTDSSSGGSLNYSEENKNQNKGQNMNKEIKFNMVELAEIAGVDVDTLKEIYNEAGEREGEEAVANFVKETVESKRGRLVVEKDRSLWEKYKDLPLWQQILIGAGILGAVGGLGYLVYSRFNSSGESEWEEVQLLNQ